MRRLDESSHLFFNVVEIIEDFQLVPKLSMYIKNAINVKTVLAIKVDLFY